jgi:hypothetical protein
VTEPDLLSRKIEDLKDWQTLAWRRIADPLITTFERREIRNHLKESDAELRRCLGMVADRFRFQARPPETVGNCLADIKFRIFA